MAVVLLVIISSAWECDDSWLLWWVYCRISCDQLSSL